MRYALVQLTDKCNLRCRSCAPPNKSHGDINKLLEAIGQVKPNVVTVTGGEPTLHPNFVDFVKALKEKYLVHVATNGQLAPRILEAEPTLISVSLDYDGTEPEMHDKHRGVEGAWARAWRTLNDCKDNGLRAYPCLLLQEFNYLEILDICEWFNVRGFRLAVCYPDFKTYIYSKKPTIERWQTMKALQSIIGQYENHKWMNTELYFEEALRFTEGFPIKECAAGRLVKYINVEGRVMDCCTYNYRPEHCQECYLECFREMTLHDPEHERDVFANFYLEVKK